MLTRCWRFQLLHMYSEGWGASNCAVHSPGAGRSVLRPQRCQWALMRGQLDALPT